MKRIVILSLLLIVWFAGCKKSYRLTANLKQVKIRNFKYIEGSFFLIAGGISSGELTHYCFYVEKDGLIRPIKLNIERHNVFICEDGRNMVEVTGSVIGSVPDIFYILSLREQTWYYDKIILHIPTASILNEYDINFKDLK